MNTRTEPTLGDIENLELTETADLLAQARVAINAGVDVATDEVERAQVSGMSPAIARAERDLKAALARAQKAAETYAEVLNAEALKFSGAQHYLNNEPAAGERLFNRAAAAFRAAKPKALELAYGLSDMPGEAWDKIAKRVSNSLVSTITAAGASVEARKASIKAWGDQLSQSFDRTIARIEAVPAQIAGYVRDKGVAVKDAALTVLVKFLRWGARKEEALRHKVERVASLGEAVLKTGSGIVGDMADQVRTAGTRFSNNLNEARTRRTP